MDILAHGLWTNVLYKVMPKTRRDRTTTNWGIFFGIFPDLFAFTPVFAYTIYSYLFLHRKFLLVHPEDSPRAIPLHDLTDQLYRFSHSLIIWAVAFILIWVFIKRFPWALLGWALHICIDIFSHSSKFFPTPFLFPISNFHINGHPWSHPTFMIINYGLLVILYLFVIPRLKQKFT